MTDASIILRMPRIGLGDAIRLFGLTARAIRFYEEKGLITVRRDWRNRRVYDEMARQRLGWIAALRGADLGLREIAEVLQAEEREGRGVECARSKLESRRAAVERQLADIDTAVASLGGLAPIEQRRRARA